MLKSRLWRLPIRLVSTKPSKINIKVKHDYDENMDEIIAGNEKFYGKDRKWHDSITKGKEWRKEKREFDKFSYEKQHKDFLYSDKGLKFTLIFSDEKNWL